MDTAVFLMPELTGHFNPTIRIAKCLQRLKIKVVFAGDREIKKFSRQHGFDFYLLSSVPFSSNFKVSTHSNIMDEYIECILNRISNDHYNLRKDDLFKLFEKLEPKYIFADVFLFSDFIILQPILNKCRFTFLLSTLPTHRDKNIPPLNNQSIPNEKNNNILWRKYFFKREWSSFWQNVKYFGFGDLNVLQSKFKENKIPEKFNFFTQKVFQPSFYNVSEWVLIPKELDYPNRKLLTWQNYVGLMADIQRNEKITMLFQKYLDEILVHKKEKKGKFIYCSLGTVLESHQQRGKFKSEFFFQKLCDIAILRPNYRFLLSIGEDISNKLLHIPENVSVFNRVPQVTILPFCDLFISHGGMNSIQESAAFGIPSLIFPLNNFWDQNGNAALVKFHGFGLIGDIKKDDLKKIMERIDLIIGNSEYKEKALNLSITLKSKYQDDHFLNDFLLSNLINV